MKSMAKLNVREMIVGRLKLVLLLMIAGSLTIANFNIAKAQMINPFGVDSKVTLGKEDYKTGAQKPWRSCLIGRR